MSTNPEKAVMQEREEFEQWYRAGPLSTSSWGANVMLQINPGATTYLYGMTECVYQAFIAGQASRSALGDELYHATNALMAEIGAKGSVTTQTAEVSRVMDALHDIDGGAPRPAPAVKDALPEWYGMDTPWPLHNVLRELIKGAKVLLDEHGYDRTGHENMKRAQLVAEEMLTKLLASPPPAVPVAAREPTARWNFDATETDILVCHDMHDKGERCEFERMHPAEVLKLLNTYRSRILRIEAALEQFIAGVKG